MVVTEEIIEAGRSSKGGWSVAQRELLGATRWRKGWKWRAIGQDFPQADVEKFLALKDKHLKGREDYAAIVAAKEERQRFERETNTIGSDRYCCKTCFHLRTKNCDGLSSLSKVCKHWFSPDSKIIGSAYSEPLPLLSDGK